MRNPIGGVVEVSAVGRDMPAVSGESGKDYRGGCAEQLADMEVEKFIESLMTDAGQEIVERHECDIGGVKATMISVRSASREKKPLPYRAGDTVLRKIDRGVFQVSTCGAVPGREGWLIYLCGDEKPYDASELELLAETKHKHHSTVNVPLTKAAGGELIISMESFQKSWAHASEIHVKEVNELHAKIDALEQKLYNTQRKSGRRRQALRQLSKPFQQLSNRRKAITEANKAAVEIAEIQLAGLSQ